MLSEFESISLMKLVLLSCMIVCIGFIQLLLQQDAAQSHAFDIPWSIDVAHAHLPSRLFTVFPSVSFGIYIADADDHVRFSCEMIGRGDS